METSDPAPRGRAARALVRLCGEPVAKPVDASLMAALRRIPDPDLAAVLFAWARAGQLLLRVGAWELYAPTTGRLLVEALTSGAKRIPFGSGEHDDPITARFTKTGKLRIDVESHQDDRAPRRFTKLDPFFDAMVVDAITHLRPGSETPWPPPSEVQWWVEHGEPGEEVLRALAAHARLVTLWKGVPSELVRAAAAWLEDHAAELR